MDLNAEAKMVTQLEGNIRVNLCGLGWAKPSLI